NPTLSASEIKTFRQVRNCRLTSQRVLLPRDSHLPRRDPIRLLEPGTPGYRRVHRPRQSAYQPLELHHVGQRVPNRLRPHAPRRLPLCRQDSPRPLATLEHLHHLDHPSNPAARRIAEIRGHAATPAAPGYQPTLALRIG